MIKTCVFHTHQQASQPSAQIASAQTSTEVQSFKRVGKGKEISKTSEMAVFSKNPSQMISKIGSSQIVLQ